LTGQPGFRRMKARGQTPHPQFRVQASGRTGVSRRRDASRPGEALRATRNLIRIWVQRLEAGALDEDAVAADLIEQYGARIAALERLVGKQALELEFVKGALKSAPRRKDAPSSVIVGPPAYPSLKDAG
jgi:transposase